MMTFPMSRIAMCSKVRFLTTRVITSTLVTTTLRMFTTSSVRLTSDSQSTNQLIDKSLDHSSNKPSHPIKQSVRIDKKNRISQNAVRAIRKRLSNNQFEAALSLLHNMQPLSNATMRQIVASHALRALSPTSSSCSLFLSYLWDICYEAKVLLTLDIMYVFASSFDHTNDHKRIKELAQLMLEIPLRMPDCLQVCSLMLYLLSNGSHDEVLNQLKSCIDQSIASDPSYNLAVMRRQGELDSMLNKQQIDATVEYLRTHASSFEIRSVDWHRATVALLKINRNEDAVNLYNHWVSVMPSVDELKQLANYKLIVPNANTYSILMSSPTFSVTANQAVTHLDLFGLPYTSELYNAFLSDAMRKEDYRAAMFWLGDMCIRRVPMTPDTLMYLIGILRKMNQQTALIDDANQLAVQIWDQCIEENIAIQFGWYLNFLEAFNRRRDVRRIVQLVDMLISQTERVNSKWLIHCVFKALETHNEARKLREFKIWLESGLVEQVTSDGAVTHG